MAKRNRYYSEIADACLDYIKENIGCTSGEIANALNISWVTVDKYCKMLHKAGKLRFRETGKIKKWIAMRRRRHEN